MPPQRTSPRASRRDSQHILHASELSNITPKVISFAANVTDENYLTRPVTPPPTEIPDSSIFPGMDHRIPAKKTTHSRKKPENHIPRPPNAFILFRAAFVKSKQVSKEVETNHSTLSTIVGIAWQNLPENERKKWYALARQALEEHKQKFPQYTFKPAGKAKSTEKRKVREVGPKDNKRCAKIAHLLLEGKRGHELEDAMKKFDSSHVPEIVTRFDAPVTADSFLDKPAEAAPSRQSKKRGSQSKSRQASIVSVASTVASTSSIPSVPPSSPSSPVHCKAETYGEVDEFVESPCEMDFGHFSWDRAPTSSHLPPSEIRLSPLVLDQVSYDATYPTESQYQTNSSHMSGIWTSSPSPQDTVPPTPYYSESPYTPCTPSTPYTYDIPTRSINSTEGFSSFPAYSPNYPTYGQQVDSTTQIVYQPTPISYNTGSYYPISCQSHMNMVNHNNYGSHLMTSSSSLSQYAG